MPLKRRQFVNTAIGLSIATMIPFPARADITKIRNTSTVIPKKLRKGDTIGLIAPGYAIKEEVLEEAKKTVRAMGFVPFHTDRVLGNYGYFSDTDSERAKDLNEMFANPKIDGIICARGGYGCTRIMHLIDFENIKKNPKVLVGFSDITALLNGINQETGLITYHGPVGSTLNDPYSIDQLQRIVMYPQEKELISNTVITDDHLKTDPDYERYVITKGKTTGKLVGGSLTLINALIGTPHEIDFTNAVVCIEEVEEAPYRIDRMLTQLIEGRTFTKAKGIVFGVCSGCNSTTNQLSFNLKEVILDRIKPLGIPAVYGMSFGHIEQNFTFPIGINAEFDADKMTLELLERSVR